MLTPRRHAPVRLSATIVAAILALLAAFVAAPQQAAATDHVAVHTGTLPDGTSWRADVPADWNGTVLSDLDHASPATSPLPSWKQYLVDRGYAYVGTERNTVGYHYLRAIDNQVATVREMEAIVGREADRIISVGSSRGGFVARGAVEAHPDVFDGAVAMCGGGAGIVQTLNQKLDAVFALQVLLADQADVDASGIELVDITDVPGQMALLGQVVDAAVATPEGRARLALAASFSQMQPWSQVGTERPGARDYEAQIDNIAAAFAFGHPAVVRAGVEAAAGGNVSWNHGVDYDQLLNRSGAKQRVQALYRSAGLDLRSDLASLASAPRIVADPDAVAFAEQNITYTGEVEAPVLTMHTIGDPADPLPMDSAYADTFRRAGNNSLLRQIQVDKPGHCNFTAAERVTAVLTLIERVESGQWRNTTMPRSLNLLAAALSAQDPVLGDSAFVHVPEQRSLRPWDGRHVGSYSPPVG